jgi:hypothetical protein
MQTTLALAATGRSPLAIAYGVGVDSTAMLVGYAARGIRPDLILFSDVGAEKEGTYEYLPIIGATKISVANCPRKKKPTVHE